MLKKSHIEVDDIQLNLHITLSKAKVLKILTKITDEGHLLRKTYNKSMVYCIKQDLTAKVATPEDIKVLDDSIEDLTEKQKNILIQNNSLEKGNPKSSSLTYIILPFGIELMKLKSIPKIDELKSRISKLQEKVCDSLSYTNLTVKQNQNLKEKISKLSEGTIVIPVEKRKRVNDDYETIKESWKKKRAKVNLYIWKQYSYIYQFREIYMTIFENYPGDPKALNGELGIEEDPVPFEKAFPN